MHGQEVEGEAKEWFLKKEGAQVCVTQKMCPSWTLGFLVPHFVPHGAVSHKKLDSRMKMKHSLRQLDELDSRICMRHIMKHNWCLNLCLIEIRKSNFFIMLPHFVLHVNPRVQLFPHSEDFEAQCEAAEIRGSNPKLVCATNKSSHGNPLTKGYGLMAWGSWSPSILLLGLSKCHLVFFSYKKM